MPAEDRPELLIVGDSHAIALRGGCEALGVTSELLSFSGNLWHLGHIVMHRKRGIWARSPALQKRLQETALRLGSDALPAADVPVVATFGYHLGRIVPQFHAGGHCANAAEFLGDENRHFVSQAMLDAYIAHFRRSLVQVLKRMAGRAPLIAVAPPLIHESANYPEFMDTISDMIQAEGIRFINPCDTLFGRRKALPAEFLTADGGHGDAIYGAMVIQLLRDQGLIRVPR